MTSFEHLITGTATNGAPFTVHVACLGVTDCMPCLRLAGRTCSVGGLDVDGFLRPSVLHARTPVSAPPADSAPRDGHAR